MAISFQQLKPGQQEQLCNRIISGIAKSHRFPPIRKVELFLTEDCNLLCDYCFVATKKAGRQMFWEVARKAIDFLLTQSRDAPDIDITFFGGEPLLELSLMRRIAEYVERRARPLGKEVHYAVTTNGTLMSEEILAHRDLNNLQIGRNEAKLIGC